MSRTALVAMDFQVAHVNRMPGDYLPPGTLPAGAHGGKPEHRALTVVVGVLLGRLPGR
jgi:hypothetical protein